MKSQKIMFTIILSALVCFGLLPGAQAEGPAAPDTALAGGNTADGQGALFSLTTGLYNSAFGLDSLLSNTDASFNTGVGAGTLLLSDGTQNTAVGAAALFSNTTAGDNTAVGTFAMFTNADGVDNTAVGSAAMLTSVDGGQNTVVGAGAGPNLIVGNSNTYVGQFVGTTVPDEINTIRIGDISIDGFGSAECFIGGIFNNFQPVGGSVVEVTLDLNDDHLGWDVGPNQGGSAPSVPSRGAPVKRGAPQPAARPQHPARPQDQAMLNDKVEKLQVVVQLQQKQIGALTAQLKEQAAQIQKVSAQVEMSKPAAKVVVNKP
jgi:hypothetical protein